MSDELEITKIKLIMKHTLLILGLLVSMGLTAQKQYSDVPYIQDYAQKFVLSDEFSEENFCRSMLTGTK